MLPRSAVSMTVVCFNNLLKASHECAVVSRVAGRGRSFSVTRHSRLSLRENADTARRASAPAAGFDWQGKSYSLKEQRCAGGAYVPQFGMYAPVPGQEVKAVLAVIMLMPGHGTILHQ